jgi:uncharacterized protein YcbX
MAICVKELWRYPAKSCEGNRLTATRVDEGGMEYDRNWVVVNERGVFQTQRVMPKLALIRTHPGVDPFSISSLGLSTLGHHPIVAYEQATDSKKVVNFNVFKDGCQGFDCGDEVAAWFSKVLGEPCRLIKWNRKPRKSVRYPEIRSKIAYQDGYPLLAILEKSLDAFNAFLAREQPEARPKSMLHFRPNLVLAGAPAFDEDKWRDILVTGPHHPPMRLRGIKLCDRCTIPDVDPRTGEKEGTDTRKLLEAMGRGALPMYPDGSDDATGPCFGMNLVWIPEPEGYQIEEGDTLTIESRWDS